METTETETETEEKKPKKNACSLCGLTKGAHGKCRCISSAVRVEIVKPLSETWDELGRELRIQASQVHRLINAGVLEAALHAHTKKKKKNGEKEPGPNIYRTVKQEILAIQEWGREKGGDAEDRFADFDLPGGTTSAIARIATQHVGEWRKHLSTKGLSTFTKGQPIPIRRQEWHLLKKDGAIVLDLKLRGSCTDPSRSRSPRTQLVLRGSKGSQWARIREFLEVEEGKREDTKLGSLKILYDKKKGKWFVIISFTRLRPAPPDLDPERVMVIHRGCRNFLYYATNTGHSGTLIQGAGLRSQKQRQEARRRAIRRGRHERGDGARGHGKDRKLRDEDVVGDKIARIVRTSCQQAAARCVKVAKFRGCGTIYREDYGGIKPDETTRYVTRFPFFQLGSSIDWAFQKIGMDVGTIPSQYISTTCPRCGLSDERNLRKQRWVFRCIRCAFERPGDLVAVLNELRRTGCDMSIWDKRMEDEMRLTKALNNAKDGGGTEESNDTEE